MKFGNYTLEKKADKMKKVAILGAGVMGSAVAWPLSDNGYEIHLIGTHLDGEIIQRCKQERYHPRLKRKLPENVIPFSIEELEKALDGVEFIVSGVNSKGVRWVGQTLAPYVKSGDRIIAITKGLEAEDNGSLVILPEVMRQEFPPNVREQVSLAAVGGPCIAGELAGRRQSCVYFGSRELETSQYLAEFFRTDYYHVSTTNDIVGLELAVALKNAYALGVGIAAGILKMSGGVDHADAYMHNLAAAMFARGCTEMVYFLKMQKLDPQFAYGLPGAGDLYVTSQGGRSVTIGSLIGQGKTYQEAAEIMAGETLESVMIIQQIGKALPKIFEKGLLKEDQFPFMNMLVDIIVHEKPIQLNLNLFFNEVIKE